MKVFVSPHDDDHALFGAFTCLRERPVLVVVFDGHIQQQRGFRVTAEDRAKETAIAADILECSRVVRLGFSDAVKSPNPARMFAEIAEHLDWCSVTDWYLPAIEVDGHHQHNAVGMLNMYAHAVTHYLTYTTKGKSTHGRLVEVERDDWIASKLQALSVYKSQMENGLGCRPHFLRSQEEYYL